MSKFNREEYIEYQLNKGHVLNKDKRDPKTGLYGNFNQISLKEWVDKETKKSLFHKEEVVYSV